MSQQINLFNPIFLKQKKIFTALPMAQALGVILAGALLLTWYASSSVDELEMAASEGKATLAKREQQLAKANSQFAPRTRSARLEADLADAEAELAALDKAASALQGGVLGNTAGYAEYFRAFSRQSVSGLWLTGVSITGAGTDIGLRGKAMHATLIPNYISRLAGENILHGKTFASLNISRPEALSAPVETAVAAPAPMPAATSISAATAATAASLVALPAPAPVTPSAPATPAAPPFVEFNLTSTAVPETAK